MPSKKTRKSVARVMPLGVKVISVLTYVCSGLLLLLGVLLLGGSTFFANFLAASDPFFAEVGTAALILVGLLLLVVAVFGLLIGRGLWMGQQWARIVTLVFVVLGILGALGSLFSGDFKGIFDLIVHLVVGWYLAFNKEAVAAFK